MGAKQNGRSGPTPDRLLWAIAMAEADIHSFGPDVRFGAMAIRERAATQGGKLSTLRLSQ
jgi:hypothetical protein